MVRVFILDLITNVATQYSTRVRWLTGNVLGGIVVYLNSEFPIKG